ncbi:MAG: cobalamin-dependent protein, partial [Sinobacteraceae bacterium]|nr:cobalamin-dependent protein [Nevskiaceae bacterium]
MTSSRRHILLINPTIAPRRHARFPLAVLNLSAALDGHYDSTIIDGNVDRDFINTAVRLLGQQTIDAVGLSVMGGPQLPTAIAASRAIRQHFPDKPIIWGGHFPTLCAEPALKEDFVDYAIRGQGEETLRELLASHFAEDCAVSLPQIAGLSWRAAGQITHNPPRAFSAAGARRPVPYERLSYDPRTYLQRTFLGARTAGYQAALGCRFRCTFCGVAAMFRGRTALPSEQHLDNEL